MSDYYPLLSRMVGGLANNTGETRRALYGRARAALCEQLRGREPPLTDSEITRERLSLEAAIRKFEAETIRRPRGAPVPESIATPNAEEIGARAAGAAPAIEVPAASAQVSPARRSNAKPQARREQLVELALVAQLVEAREGRSSKPRTAGAAQGPGATPVQASRAAPPKPVAPGRQPLPSKLSTRPVEAPSVRPVTIDDAPWRLGRGSLLGPERRADFLTGLLATVYVILGFAQLVAFFHGLQTAFGLGGVASIGIFMLLYLTGSPGSIPMAIVAFYGAWRGWQWPMLGAALFAFPFVILSFGFLGMGGIYHFFYRRRTAPLAEMIRSFARSPWWRERARRWRVVWSRGRRVRIRAPRYRTGGSRAEKHHLFDESRGG